MSKKSRRIAYIPNFTHHHAIRRAKMAAMRGDLDRAERWLKFVERLEKANARDAARFEAAMKQSEDQAFHDRMRTRIDQRDFL